MSKHAYLIIANGKFDQLEFLVKLLDDSRNDIYILIDKKLSITKKLRLKFNTAVQSSRLYLYNDSLITWGDYSQINAEMHLFKLANDNGPYSYYHLLSGQDLPLHSQDYIHNFYDNNPNKLFLTIPSNEIYIRGNIPKRVIYNYKFIHFYGRSKLNRYGKKVFKILEHINFKFQDLFGITYRKKKSLPKIEYASNWLSLNEEAISYLIKNKQQIYDIFHNAFLCDELFVPTILLQNSKFKDMVYLKSRVHDKPDEIQGNLHYINWWDGSPYTWTDNDIDKIKYARDLGHLFSRKFNLNNSPKIKELIIKLCEN